jgi:hypothetical protein
LCCRIHLLQRESAVHQSNPGHVLRALGHSISRETEFKHHTGPRYTRKYSLGRALRLSERHPMKTGMCWVSERHFGTWVIERCFKLHQQTTWSDFTT